MALTFAAFEHQAIILSCRFGIQYVNYTTLERTYKRSAFALCEMSYTQVIYSFTKDNLPGSRVFQVPSNVIDFGAYRSCRAGSVAKDFPLGDGSSNGGVKNEYSKYSHHSSQLT